MRHLAYIVSQFPELHETFILREVLELRRRGYQITVLSLKPCRDAIIHPEARTLMAETVYAPFIRSWAVWAASLYWLAHRPLRTCTTFGQMLWLHRRSPGRLGKLIALWPKLLYFARVIQRLRPDHLHAHWATVPTSVAMAISRLVDRDWSFSAHAWDIFVKNPELPEKLRRARFVFTCTDYNRRFLLSLAPDAADRIVRVYHGVSATRGAGEGAAPGGSQGGQTSDAVPLVLSVGRLVETKGFPYLLQACRELKQRGVRFTCVIVGDGRNRLPLQRQLKTLGIADCVRFAGALPQVELQALYRRARLFVLPSVMARNGDRDGIPNVILEAMIAGLPVVSTKISGIPEAVQHGVTGLLVPPRDHGALAAALEHILSDADLARRLGAEGRRYAVRTFSEAAHMDLLDTTMRQRVRPARRRVLYVIWSLAIGGAERVVSLLAHHLDRSRYEPRVVCLNDAGPLAAELRTEGIAVTALHKRGPVDLRVLWRLVRLIRRERIDLVHTHLWGANLWGRLAARLAGVPVIATEHNTDSWKRPWHLALDRWLVRTTRRVVAVSDAVRTFYVSKGIPADRIETIPNGIETDRFPAPCRSRMFDDLGWSPETPVCVAIGRLVPAKQHDVFIDVMAQVCASRPAARALIVGDGPLRDALEQQIQQRGLAGRVVVTGLRDDIPAILRGARAVVFTSEREGLPMVLLEAMASGVPVIAHPVGGIPEVLEHGRTGWLVSQGDREALVTQLIRLIDDPALAQRVGSAAQAMLQARWSVATMVQRHERLYQRTLRPPRRVTMIIDHLGVGGAQRQFVELARRLPHERYAVSIISLSAERMELAEQCREAGLPVTTIHQSGTWSWRCFWSLLRVLRSSRPEIVHTWLFTADLYGRLAAWLAGVPVIVSALRSPDPGKPVHYVAVDRLLRHVTNAFTVNADAIGAIFTARERIDPSKMHTVYNGIDLDQFDPERVNGTVRRRLQLDAAAPLIGIVARLAPEKDHVTFLRAAALVARERPEARFLIVGSGPLRGELQEVAARVGVAAQVRFLEAPSDIADVFAALDVVVISSRYEGCSNVILEGMAMGKPVIATEVGGNPELVVPGETGLLVPVAQPEPLARAILELCRDAARRDAMGARGRRRVEESFSMERMVEQTGSLYAGLLRQRTGRDA